MLTEMNSSHYNGVSSPNSDFDARTITGAMNLSRMYALAAHYGCAGAFMWSVKESDLASDRGYLVGNSQNGTPGSKRPSWYFYKMLSEYFSKGTYYPDEELESKIGGDAVVTSTASGGPGWLHWYEGSSPTATAAQAAYNASLVPNLETKAFAVRGTSIAVMILNHSGSAQDFAIRFTSSGSFSASTSKHFRFNMSLNVEHAFTGTAGSQWGVVEANSAHVLIFDCQGGLQRRYRYRQSVEASNPALDFDGFYGSGTPGIFASSVSTPTPNCLESSTGSTITASGGFSNYSWYKLPNTSLSGSSNVLNALTPGIYRTTASSGCGTVATTAVVHQNSPLVEAGKSLTFCPGTSTSGVLGSTLLATSNFGGYSYTWSPPGTVYSATLPVNNTSVTSSQYFTLTATDGNGCTFSDKVYIEVEDDIQLLIRDDSWDVGQTPTPSTPQWMNPLTYPPWISPDIYTNYANNTTLGDVSIQPGSIAYVKVRVHNKGCMPLQSAATVSLYFTAAGVGNNWSTAWVNYSCSSFYPGSFCAITPSYLCGDFIGAVNTPTIASGGSAVVVFTWTVPPDYNCMYPGHKAGFKNIFFNNWTLKAIVDHPQDVKGNLTSNAYYNITNDNNVAAKKVVRYFPQPYNPNDNGPSGIYVFNNHSQSSVRLDFVSRNDYNNESVLNYGDAVMYFPNEYLQQWIDNGEQGEGIVLLSDTSVQVVSGHAYMDEFPLPQGQAMPAGLIVFPTNPVDMSGGESFDLDVILRPSGDPDSIVDGITYGISKEEWDCGDCGGSALRQSFTTNDFENDSLHIISDFTISAGQTRTYERCVLRFAENTGITVEQGGKLVLKNCRLEAACKHQQWKGINVAGAVNGFTAESCNFRHTATPLTAANAEGLVIRNSAFIGISQSSGFAIRLQNSGSFDISHNHIARFAEGISTSQTFTTQVANTIERNVFQLMETCIRSQNDDHRNTAILCNTFRYRKYGIYADSTDFSDFGSAQQPAGNRFKGKSQLAFHKVNQLAGNSPAYYFSALLPDSTGMNISAVPAVNESVCYPGDSASSASSRVTSLTNHRNAAFGLKAIPNPGNGDMLIVVSFGDAHNGILLIRDAQGRLIDQFEMHRSHPELRLSWSGRARGIYFATLELPSGQKAHTKIILQE